MKPIINDTAVNVIYFTSRCNLACTYCYEELQNKEKQVLTKEDIRKSIDDIIFREPPDQQTLFVLFGGEVTLEWDNAIYFMEYAYSKKKNVHFNISTNGIKFNDDEFIVNYKKLKFFLLGLTSLDISFDGIGNKERIDHTGNESTPILLQVFRKLQYYNVPFRIRYTIHKCNINMLYKDITMLSTKIKAKRIITSIAWNTLSDNDIETLNSVKNKLLEDWKLNKITIPICDIFCEACSGCKMNKELKTYFTTEGNVTTYKTIDNVKQFQDFKEKE